jgi:hypothetical protein
MNIRFDYVFGKGFIRDLYHLSGGPLARNIREKLTYIWKVHGLN